MAGRQLAWRVWVCGFAAALPLVLMVTVGVLVWADLAAPERAALGPILASRLPLVVLLGLFGAAGAGGLAWWLSSRYADACLRLADSLELGGEGVRALSDAAAPEVQTLIERLVRVLANLDAAQRNVARQVTEARAELERERNQLAALLAEMPQSVLACNREGQILLYNARARDLLGGEAGLVGLGRFIGGIFDRRLLAHTRERLHRSLQSGRTQVEAGFLTATPSGRLLRVRATPVLESGDATPPLTRLTGYLLLVEDVTRESEHAARRDRLVEKLTHAQRAGLASIRAAAGNLSELGDSEPAQRQRFLTLIGEQARQLSEGVTQGAQEFALLLRADVALEDMLGDDLIAAAQRRIEARTGVRTRIDGAHHGLWVRVDSFALVQVFTVLAQQVCDACNPRELRLSLTRQEGLAQLELGWWGASLSNETAMGWEIEPMVLAGEASPRSIREVLARHGGQLVFGRERVDARSFFRVLLPAVVPEREAQDVGVPEDGRPEYYDFNLFVRNEQGRALAERPLSTLTYTVFDTETTGLDPSGGDEIIQIGAVRIVNGRLLRGETFEQLVDPRRAIHPAAQAVHGITQARLDGQPGIERVLPVFHAYARDTVLVGHNAAFDMRFLQIKEAMTGLAFDQPVLDTLLLSAVLHPDQDSHRLDAIAERFGLPVLNRHDAVSDARLTAQVFLRMIPLLAERGIVTLGEAREASEKTYHARLRY